ncbi:MAG: hypothetical protein JW987_13295 [Anaerolineaceae bacterium]|nr:hypothetical protein [Anaerolineaceae bacterium]
MLTVQKVDLSNRAEVNRFVQFHYDLYKGTPQWVPPFYMDIRMMLNPQKHPFYEHSEGDFFVAMRGKEVVGRLGVLENKPFNKYHGTRKAQFYLFDTVDDLEVSRALFDRAMEWCKARGLDTLVGPKGLSGFDGYGIQVEGFELRQMMTMMQYNFPYYPQLMEKMGFEKEVDFVSCYLAREHFDIPEKAKEVARRVREKGNFRVVSFKSKAELKRYAVQFGETYNKTFVNNWEYYPLTEREIKFAVDTILTVAVPQYIKFIAHGDDLVGFLLGFPDISSALQRQGGRITPWGLADIMLEFKKTRFISLNGVGVLPEYKGRGAVALLYDEMSKVLQESPFAEGELTQMAETAKEVRIELVTYGAKPWKNHRIYTKAV